MQLNRIKKNATRIIFFLRNQTETQKNNTP